MTLRLTTVHENGGAFGTAVFMAVAHTRPLAGTLKP